MKTGQISVGIELAIRFRSPAFAFGGTGIRLHPGRIVRIRSLTFAFIRLYSLTIFLFMDDLESGKGRQFLPGGDGLRRAPECVTANSPEYATLKGLKHRDSPQYVTKKIYSSQVRIQGRQHAVPPQRAADEQDGCGLKAALDGFGDELQEPGNQSPAAGDVGHAGLALDGDGDLGGGFFDAGDPESVRRFGERGVHVAGQDVGDDDGQFRFRGLLPEAGEIRGDEGLAGVVGGGESGGGERGNGGDAHELPASALLKVQVGDIGLCGETEDVHEDGFVFRFPVQLGVDVADAGIEDDQIHAIHFSDQLAQGVHRGGGLRDIANFDEDVLAQLAAEVFQQFAPAGHQANGVTARVQLAGQGAADARRRAGDDGFLHGGQGYKRARAGGKGGGGGFGVVGMRSEAYDGNMSSVKMTADGIRAMKGKRFAALTAYDFPMTRLLDETGVPLILVGDSLGMVVLGYTDTTPVTMEEIEHHLRAAARAKPRALLAADLPYHTYLTPEDALKNARRLVAAGAEAVKAEGGRAIEPQVRAITGAGIPFIGHLGMLPQSVRDEGGYRVKGREEAGRQALLADAQALEAAGAFAVVLELVAPDAAAELTQKISIPTIGIGSGPDCDGQILVTHDLLGLFPWFTPKFVKPKLNAAEQMRAVVEEWMRTI